MYFTNRWIVKVFFTENFLSLQEVKLNRIKQTIITHMKKLNFKSLLADFIAVVLRFYLVLISVFGLAIMSLLEINVKRFEQDFNVWSFFILATIASFSLTLFLENAKNKLLGIGTLLLTLSSIALYSFFYFNNKVEWEMMQFAAILFATLLSITFVLYFRKNKDASFWIFTEKISREIITTLIYVSIIQGGLSLAIYAVNVLFNVKVESEVYGSLAVVCYLMVAPVYFLMNLPTKSQLYNDTPDYAKFLKILGLNVLLPILGLYLVILYFYLIKIIVIWELPNGWVTTLVSILALGGYLAKFLLFPISENSVVRFLNRYFSVLLLPLIVLMSVGLARRIDDYGISINRLYVLVFNIWLYAVSIYLFFTHSKHLRWLVISFAAVLLLVSVGPWSVFATTKRVVEKDLTTLLIDNKLFVNNQLVENKSDKIAIKDSVKAEISDKVYYYITNFGLESWKLTFNDKRKLAGVFQITESLGVNNYTLNEKTRSFYTSNSSKEVYDINEYKYLITNLEINEDSNLVFLDKNFKIEFIKNKIEITDMLKASKFSFPLQKIVSELFVLDNENETLKNKLLVQKSNTYMLLISNLSVEYKSSSDFKITQMSFTLYLK